MKFKGISYDTGTEYLSGTLTRTGLTDEIISKDMSAIKNLLHCNCVRIFGKDPQLLILSAQIALESGLNVWLSPRFIDDDPDYTIKKISEIAKELEMLRSQSPLFEIVFVIAAEASLDTKGFIKGETIHERIRHLSNPLFFLKKAFGIKPTWQPAFNRFLSHAVKAARQNFSGRVTYAAGMWEIVDWKNFDFISVNLYKASFNKTYFDKAVHRLSSEGKLLAITEFGCCTYVGADKSGPTGYAILDTKAHPPVFKEQCQRSEQTQADYLLDSLQTFAKRKAEAVFIFDFYSQQHPYNTNPDLDYDKASFSITKSVGQNEWEPKLAFDIVSKFYQESNKIKVI